MTLKLTGAGTGGLFDILGKAFYSLNVLNTARGTTVPTEVEDFLAEWEGLTGADLDYQGIIQGIAAASQNWQRAGNSLAASVRGACESLLVEMVNDDAPQPDRAVKRALQYLIDQMEGGGYYVDANAVTLTLTADTGNDTDVAICYTTRRGDGREQENMLAEDIDVSVTAESGTTPTLTFLGEAAMKDRLSHLWPLGSGCNRSIVATSAVASLLSNGDFEDETVSGIPDYWTIATGTPNKTVALTDAEIQTITIAGTPSGGSYTLRWTNSQGITRTTDTLPYNASGSAVQAALRTLPGLEQITVASTGTSPNYIHTITFVGTSGSLSQLTSSNAMTGGTGATIIHATTVEGDDGAFKGKALQIISDGTGELTTVYHPLSGLSPETVYFVHCRIARIVPDEESSDSSSSSLSASSWSTSSHSSSSSTATQSTSSTEAEESSTSESSQSLSSSSSSTAASETSSSSQSLSSSSEASETSSSTQSESSSSSHDLYELRLEIVDGIDGSRTVDGEGNDNELRIDLDTIGSTHVSKWFSFRLQRSVASPVYIRIRLMRQLPKHEIVYLDEMAVAEGVELYKGGPIVAAFSGINDASVDDGWSLTSTNDRAGAFQEWYNRVYSMAEKGLLLPSSGSTQIADGLIG